MAEKTAETWAEAARQDKGQDTRPPPAAAPDTWAEAVEKDKKPRPEGKK